MTRKVDAPPPYLNLTGLCAPFGVPSIDIKAPLLSVSAVPSDGAKWMHAVRPPRLDAPDIDTDSIALYIAVLQTTITGLQTGINLESIENNKHQKQADFDKAKQQQLIADAKAKEASKAAETAMVLEWLAAIAAIIGAVLAAAGAIAVTGGLAAGLAIVGVIMAVQTLSNTAIKQAQMNGREINTTDALGKTHKLSLSWGLAVEMEQAKRVADGAVLRKDAKGNILDAQGKIMTKDQVQAALKNPMVRIMSEDEMGKERLALTLIIEIGIAVAMIGCGVKSMVSAGKNAAEAAAKAALKAGTEGSKTVRLGIEASAKTWARFARLSEGLSAATEVVGGAGDIAQGVINIDGARAQNQSDIARSEQSLHEKRMKVAMAILRELQTACKNLVHALNETYESMSQQVQELDRLRVSIARKIVQTAS
jgi:hypothetical protein